MSHLTVRHCTPSPLHLLRRLCAHLQSACRASIGTPHATWAVKTNSGGASSDNAFSKEYRNQPCGAGRLAFQAPYAEGKELLLRHSSRWSEDPASWLQKANHTTQGNYKSAFSHQSEKCSPGRKCMKPILVAHADIHPPACDRLPSKSPTLSEIVKPQSRSNMHCPTAEHP